MREGCHRSEAGDTVEALQLKPSSLGPVKLESWESELSEAVAHLVGAYVAIERPIEQTAAGEWATLLFDLASRSICTALLALDECSLLTWCAPESNHPVTSGSQEPPMWRYRILTTVRDPSPIEGE